MRIMGIDPGSNVTGYGIIEKTENRLNWVDDGQISPSKKYNFYKKLFYIFSEIKEIINRYQPEEIALEDIFYSKNVKSSIKLGHIRGAIVVASFSMGIPLFEYTPLEVKKAVTGYGAASKSQVKEMVKLILNIEKDISFDSSDALAIAICHANTRR